MDLFSSLLKTTTDQVTKLGKGATDLVHSVANVSSTAASNSLPSSDEASKESEESSTFPSFIFSSGEMSKKALTNAKYLGSFVSTSAASFGSFVVENAKHLVTSMENSTIVQQDFFGNLEADDVLIGYQCLPWRGLGIPMKKKILALSTDRRTFVRPPPNGVQFAFDLKESTPVAMALLQEDDSLCAMRYELVPKVVNEENFWRNYFYRISLIKQGATLDDTDSGEESMDKTSSFPKVNFDSANLLEDDELTKDLESFEVNSSMAAVDEDEINLELSSFNVK